MPTMQAKKANRFSARLDEFKKKSAADKRRIYKVGISFSSETGTVNDFAYKPCE